MASQSHFEINVSKDGQHLFATASRSLITSEDYAQVLALFKTKFPESEGYRISGTYWQTTGLKVDDQGHLKLKAR